MDRVAGSRSSKSPNPCPFCNCNNEKVHVEECPMIGGSTFFVYCDNCGSAGPSAISEDGAIDLWNDRPFLDEGHDESGIDPCPWCGCESFCDKVEDDSYRVNCGDPSCESHGVECSTKEEAIESWNRDKS